ncbi:MAG: glycosyl hydrolase family 79 C-terminal domain-containing protein [Terracidiphilus sp.]
MSAAIGAAALSAPRRLMAQAGEVEVSLAIDASTSLAKVPEDFMGLSYESGQLAYPDFFSPRNTALIEIFRRLTPAGVLRLGGNLSEFTVWSETEPATPPEAGGLVGPDPGHREPRTFTITPLSIRNLLGFLNATGWRCIYGLNLGGGSLTQALAEGAFVAKTLGSKLMFMQFGNEPDLFKHRDRGDKPWTYDEFLARWKTFRAAFQEKLPTIPVAGPDTAFNQIWFKRFTLDVPKEVVMSTSHYYAEGPPTDPEMTIDLLLHPGEKFESSCRDALASSKAAGLPFRMAEGNSCYNAGKPGVSDTFASALWAGDFCLQLAAMGCVGVNLHGGANGYYSPIVGSIGSGFAARPEFYGLMLAQEFAGRGLERTTLKAKGANLTAYAAGGDGAPGLVAVFNKDARDAQVTISGAAGGFKRAVVERLLAPAIDSKQGVTLRGATVESDGQFHPRAGEPLTAQSGKLSVRVQAYSAALIRLG